MELNHLIIVLDSCRFDTYVRAKTPNLDEHFDVIEAGALACFTYPSLAAIFQGFYPCTRARRPLYNRYVTSSLAWENSSQIALIRLVKEQAEHLSKCMTIPEALRQRGHLTVAVGAVEWFEPHNPLSIGFEHFLHSQKGEESILRLIESVDRELFYAVLNFGETHRPFDCPWTEGMLTASPASANTYESVYDEALHSKQVRALEYVDHLMPPLFAMLKSRTNPTLVCLCADHGEAMGEDGCYGHGFYHPNVMAVPLAWTLFVDNSSHILNENTIQKLINRQKLTT